jgi:hypothetical protein
MSRLLRLIIIDYKRVSISIRSSTRHETRHELLVCSLRQSYSDIAGWIAVDLQMTPQTAGTVTAYATVALVAVTVGAVIAAFLAIRSAREENRKWTTLSVCAQFELCSSVCQANEKIFEAFRNGVPSPADCEKNAFYAKVVLNYLDGIAIGVHQGLYIETLARDHLKIIVHKRVLDLLETTFAKDAKLDKQDWSFLTAMAEKWRKNQPYVGS